MPGHIVPYLFKTVGLILLEGWRNCKTRRIVLWELREVLRNRVESATGAVAVGRPGVPRVPRRKTPPEAQPRRHCRAIHDLDGFEGVRERFRPGKAFQE